jgi:hypothetical protein
MRHPIALHEVEYVVVAVSQLSKLWRQGFWSQLRMTLSREHKQLMTYTYVVTLVGSCYFRTSWPQ